MARSAGDKLQHINFAAGINQSGGTRGATTGTLDQATNCRIRATGRLQKRCGTSAITGTTATTEGTQRAVSASSAQPRPTERPAFLATVGDQKICGTSAGDAFIKTTGNWFFSGCFGSMQPVATRLPIAGQKTTDFDWNFSAVAVLTTGHICHAAAVSGNNLVHVSVESPDGVRIYYDAISATVPDADEGPFVKCVVVNDQDFLVVYVNGSSLDMRAIRITSGVVSSVTDTLSIASLGSVGDRWDTAGYPAGHASGSVWFLVHQDSGAQCTISKRSSVGGTVGSAAVIALTSAYLSLYLDYTNAVLWLGYNNAPGAAADVGYATYTVSGNPTLALGPTTIDTTGTDANSAPPLFGPRYSTTTTDAFFIYTKAAAAGSTTIYTSYYGAIESGGLVGPFSAAHIVPASKPDAQQRVWCQWVTPQDVSGPTGTTRQDVVGRYVLCRFVDLTTDIAARNVVIEDVRINSAGNHVDVDPLEADRGAPNAPVVVSENLGYTTFWSYPAIVQNDVPGIAGSTGLLVHHRVLQYKRWNQGPRAGAVETSGGLVVAGMPTTLWGNPMADSAPPGAVNIKQSGTGAVEIGFAHPPAIGTITATANASGLAAGTYSYKAAFQWVDALGNRHLSEASPPVTIVLTSPSNVAVEVTDTQIGQRFGNIVPSVLLFRTLDGGTTYHLCEAGQSVLSANGILTFNQTSADSDDDIDQNEILYTDGGVLDNVIAPACRYLVNAEDRLWVGGLFDSTIIEASKVRVPGEPFNFTGDASHQIVLPGACTGLAYQDGQVVAFTADGIYLCGGDGPNDQGAGTFLPPRSLVRGLGCPLANSASILETEAGIFFRSATSWFLIPRGFGTPVDIGGAIEDEDSYPISSALTETANYRLARFLVGDSDDTTSGTVLTYDLMNGQWFKDTYGSPAAFSVIGAWPSGLALFQNDLSSNSGTVRNVVWEESESLIGDAAATDTYITATARTNWQYPFGAGGWGRVSKVLVALEEVASAVVRKINVTVETDANSYAPAASSIAAGTEGDAYYRLIQVPNQTCTCYRLTVSDAKNTAGDGNSPGFRYLSATVELDPLGLMRLTSEAETMV